MFGYKKLTLRIAKMEISGRAVATRLSATESTVEHLRKRISELECNHRFKFKKKSPSWMLRSYVFVCEICGKEINKLAQQLTKPERAYLESLGYLDPKKKKTK
jgi:hypothetical protein